MADLVCVWGHISNKKLCPEKPLDVPNNNQIVDVTINEQFFLHWNVLEGERAKFEGILITSISDLNSTKILRTFNDLRSYISNTWKIVSWGIQTLRSGLWELGYASFCQPTSPCLDTPMKHSFSCLMYYLILEFCRMVMNKVWLYMKHSYTTKLYSTTFDNLECACFWLVALID